MTNKLKSNRHALSRHDDYDQQEDSEETLGVSQFSSVIYMNHDFYINGVIGPSIHYVSLFNSLATMGEMNNVNLHINSEGGDVFTTIQLIKSMKDCQADIHAIACGQCASSATMLFLAADSWEVEEHSVFLFHNYSGMRFGKGGEMYDNIVFEREWSRKLMTSMYKGFLSSDEIEQILNNKDIWMGADEVIARLKAREGANTIDKNESCPVDISKFELLVD